MGKGLFMLIKGSRLIHLRATTRDNDQFLCRDVLLSSSGRDIESLVLQEFGFPYTQYIVPQSLICRASEPLEMAVRLFTEDLQAYRADALNSGVLSLFNFEVPCSESDNHCICLLVGRKGHKTYSLQTLFGFKIEGVDGFIGPLEEVVFNTRSLATLYFVTSLKRIHSRRIVAPIDMSDRIDWNRRTIFLNVKKEALALDPQYYFEYKERDYSHEENDGHGRSSFGEPLEPQLRVVNF